MAEFESSVHATRSKERMAFEVYVDRSATLSLIKQITVKCDELTALSRRLVDALSVEKEDQSR